MARTTNALTERVACGDLLGVRTLTDKARYDPNGPLDEDGQGPLHVATRRKGLADIVEALLNAGADPNAKDNFGRTPLDNAFYIGDAQTAKALVHRGAAYTPGDEQLQNAVAAGAAECVRMLIDAGADPKATESSAPNLLFAALRQCLDPEGFHVALELIKNGCPVDAIDAQGRTALHWAAARGESVMANLIRLLINGEYGQLDVNLADSRGDTPLQIAAENQAEGVVRTLLENGADPDPIRAQDGCTPLLIAAQQANASIVHELLVAGASPNAVATVKHPDAPLAMAAQSPNGTDTIRVLLGASACDPNGMCAGHPALTHAALLGHLPAMHLIIDAGADIERRSPRGSTPLHAAAVARFSDGVLALLSAGAEVMAVTDDGSTAMHLAVTDRNQVSALSEGDTLTTLAALAEAGVDPNARTKQGLTALHVAVANGSPEIVEALLACGANPDVPDAGGKTARQYARDRRPGGSNDMAQTRHTYKAVLDMIEAPSHQENSGPKLR